MVSKATGPDDKVTTLQHSFPNDSFNAIIGALIVERRDYHRWHREPPFPRGSKIPLVPCPPRLLRAFVVAPASMVMIEV